jgi:tetratricopeptide (TPR) repeat protein
MKVKIFFLVLSLLTFNQVIFSQTEQEILKLIELEKYSLAIFKAQQNAAANPNDPVAQYLLGKALYADGMLDSSDIFFRKGIAASGEFPLNYLAVALIHSQKGRKTEAAAFVDSVMKKDISWDTPMLLEGAQYLSKLGTDYFDDADKLINSINKKEKNTSAYYLTLGDYYAAQNNFSLASQNYQKAIDTNPSEYRALLEKSKIYKLIKNYTEAESILNKLLEINPDYSKAYFELSDLYSTNKQFDKAADAYANYVAKAESSYYNLMRLAGLFFGAKKYEPAISTIKEVLKLNPEDANALRLLAYCYAENGNNNESLDVFGKYFNTVLVEKIFSTDFEKYASILEKSGFDSLAIINYKNALALDTTKVKLYNTISGLYIKSKKWRESIEMLESKKSRFPDNFTVQDHFDLGKNYYFIQDYNNAINSLNQVISIKPDFLAGYLWLARTSASLDPESEQGLAKPYYEKYIELAIVDPQKYKKDLIESYSYLGYYYYLQKDNASSKKYWEEVLVLDPENVQANDVVRQLK